MLCVPKVNPLAAERGHRAFFFTIFARLIPPLLLLTSPIFDSYLPIKPFPFCVYTRNLFSGVNIFKLVASGRTRSLSPHQRIPFAFLSLKIGAIDRGRTENLNGLHPGFLENMKFIDQGFAWINKGIQRSFIASRQNSNAGLL